MLSVSGPPTFSAAFIFFSLPDVSLNHVAFVVRVIDCKLNWNAVSVPPVPPPYEALRTAIWLVIHAFGTLPPATVVFFRITWNTTGTVTELEDASCAAASRSAAGCRDSQPVSLSVPVVRTSSRVIWPVDRPTAPCRLRQPPLPPIGAALAMGAASDATRKAAHRVVARRAARRNDPSYGRIRGFRLDRTSLRAARWSTASVGGLGGPGGGLIASSRWRRSRSTETCCAANRPRSMPTRRLRSRTVTSDCWARPPESGANAIRGS